MKGIVHLAVAATLVAGASAELRHQHMHRHMKPRQMEKPETTWVNPVATKYVYADGGAVAADEAKQCIEEGACVVVGATTPTFTPPVSKPSVKAAEFLEAKSTSTSTTSTPTPTPSTSSTSTSTSSTSTSTSTTSSSWTSTSTASSSSWSSSSSSWSSSWSTSAAATSTSTASSGSGSTFKSGTVPCSTFPSAYGAVALDWLGLDGWASIQNTGGWTPGSLISTIVEEVSGPCAKNSFCSYACAAGQTKTQWPTTSQGATGQSIGGLWCNADGYLELTNDAFDTLCMDGLGGITIENKLSQAVAVCGTNYPGDEKMSIPLLTSAGGSSTLTNIDASKAYQWEGKYTSGQFYVNNAGVSIEEACVWDSSEYPDSAGNWAPVNIGAGTDIFGITYISIFANQPTSTAELDFDIEITGDITASCYLKSGSYYGGGTGCTTALTSGGSATIVFKAKGSS